MKQYDEQDKKYQSRVGIYKLGKTNTIDDSHSQLKSYNSSSHNPFQEQQYKTKGNPRSNGNQQSQRKSYDKTQIQNLAQSSSLHSQPQPKEYQYSKQFSQSMNNKQYNNRSHQNSFNTGGYSTCYNNKLQGQIPSFQSQFQHHNVKKQLDNQQNLQYSYQVQGKRAQSDSDNSDYGKLEWANKNISKSRQQKLNVKEQPQNSTNKLLQSSFNPQALWIGNDNKQDRLDQAQQSNSESLHSDYYFYGKKPSQDSFQQSKQHKLQALKSQPIAPSKYEYQYDSQKYNNDLNKSDSDQSDSLPPGVYIAPKTKQNVVQYFGKPEQGKTQDNKDQYRNNSRKDYKNTSKPNEVSPPGLLKLKSISEQKWDNHNNIQKQHRDPDNFNKYNKVKGGRRQNSYYESTEIGQDNQSKFSKQLNNNHDKYEFRQKNEKSSNQVRAQQTNQAKYDFTDPIQTEQDVPPGLEKAKSQAQEHLLKTSDSSKVQSYTPNRSYSGKQSVQEGSQKSLNSTKDSSHISYSTAQNTGINELVRKSNESWSRPKEMSQSASKIRNQKDVLPPGVYMRPQKSDDFAQKIDDNWDLMSLAGGKERQSNDLQNQLDIYRNLFKYQKEIDNQQQLKGKGTTDLRDDTMRTSKDFKELTQKKELSEEKREKMREKRRRKNRNRRINQDKKFENYEKGRAISRMPQLNMLKNQMTSYIQTNKDVNQQQVQLQKQLLNILPNEKEEEKKLALDNSQERKDPKALENVKQQLEYRENNDEVLDYKLQLQQDKVLQGQKQQNMNQDNQEKDMPCVNTEDSYQVQEQESEDDVSSNNDSDTTQNSEIRDTFNDNIALKIEDINDFVPSPQEGLSGDNNMQKLKSIQRQSSIVIANNDVQISFSDLLRTPNYSNVYSVPEDGGEYAKIGEKYYNYEELKTGVDLPSDVDPVRREAYLEDEEFELAFKMTKHDYYKLPGWR